MHGMFMAPVIVTTHSEYVDWLENKYKTSYVQYGEKKVYFGVGQRINQVIYKAMHCDAQITVTGVFAKAAADTIKNISHGLIEPVVLNTGTSGVAL